MQTSEPKIWAVEYCHNINYEMTTPKFDQNTYHGVDYFLTQDQAEKSCREWYTSEIESVFEDIDSYVNLDILEELKYEKKDINNMFKYLKYNSDTDEYILDNTQLENKNNEQLKNIVFLLLNILIDNSDILFWGVDFVFDVECYCVNDRVTGKYGNQ